ncbi:glycosyl hydrolase-related protein [Paenibacillus silviterrae]
MTLQSELPIKGWQECDLLERPMEELHLERKLTFEIKPYEIRTFLLNY